MVAANDFLDSMAWDVAISAVLLTVCALTLPYNAKEGRVDDQAKNARLGFAIAGGASGFYLFLCGVAINVIWPFTFSSGVYNVLFGGMAALGGLVMVAGSAALVANVDLKPLAYFAAISGIYSLVDAYGILKYSLTSSPIVAALGYLGFAAPAILSIPACLIGDKRWRIVFAVFAALFALVWLIEAGTFTLQHLQP